MLKRGWYAERHTNFRCSLHCVGFCYGSLQSRYALMMTSSKGIFSALLALCEGNSLVTVEFPLQRPVTRGFDVFFDVYLSKRLSKKSRRRWFETLSRSLWRHCNVFYNWFTTYGDHNAYWVSFEDFVRRIIWIYKNDYPTIQKTKFKDSVRISSIILVIYIQLQYSRYIWNPAAVQSTQCHCFDIKGGNATV